MGRNSGSGSAKCSKSGNGNLVLEMTGFGNLDVLDHHGHKARLYVLTPLRWPKVRNGDTWTTRWQDKLREKIR